MKISLRSRAIIARLLLLGVLIIIAIFYFDSCAPSRLERKTITTIDKIVNQQTTFEEEILCQNTAKGKKIFQLNHEITEKKYLSGKSETQKKTDTLLMGIMSIDVPCPQKLSFVD